MSMKPEPENFRDLRRLLLLKRHEQPPPGYFNGFSRQVIARIEAGESGEALSFFQQLMASPSWVSRLWDSLGAKPILAGAFGVTICSVLIAGVAYSDRGESATFPSRPEQSGFAQIAPSVGLESQPVVPLTPGSIVVPVQERTSLFQDLQRRPKADFIMNAAFSTGAN
jgi:hypothetical protein